MGNLSRYLKFIVAVIGAALTAAATAFPDSTWLDTWGPIISAVLTAAAVYAVPNSPAPAGGPGEPPAGL